MDGCPARPSTRISSSPPRPVTVTAALAIAFLCAAAGAAEDAISGHSVASGLAGPGRAAALAGQTRASRTRIGRRRSGPVGALS
jgi:hypothetical protein